MTHCFVFCVKNIRLWFSWSAVVRRSSPTPREVSSGLHRLGPHGWTLGVKPSLGAPNAFRSPPMAEAPGWDKLPARSRRLPRETTPVGTCCQSGRGGEGRSKRGRPPPIHQAPVEKTAGTRRGPSGAPGWGVSGRSPFPPRQAERRPEKNLLTNASLLFFVFLVVCLS